MSCLKNLFNLDGRDNEPQRNSSMWCLQKIYKNKEKRNNTENHKLRYFFETLRNWDVVKTQKHNFYDCRHFLGMHVSHLYQLIAAGVCFSHLFHNNLIFWFLEINGQTLSVFQNIFSFRIRFWSGNQFSSIFHVKWISHLLYANRISPARPTVKSFLLIIY